MSDSSALRWFRAHLVLHEAGLLAEDEEQRFATLLEKDAECQAVFERFQATGPSQSERPEHISAYKLARWDRMQATMFGVERRYAREHLDNCKDCREDLVALGFSPRLDRDDALESGEETSARSTPPDSRPSPIPLFEERSRPSAGTAAGWALAVAACAALFVVTLQNRDQAESLVGNPRVLSLGEALRGAGVPDEVPTAPVSSDGRQIAVHISANQGYRPQELVRVQFLDSSGHELSSQTFPFGEISSPHLLILTASKPIAGGLHTLRVESVDAESDLPPLVFTFDVNPDS